MRYPVAQGFYPWRKDELKKLLDELFRKAKNIRGRKIIGGVVPHAGYVYSGITAAHFYKNIGRKYESVIILGTNHTGLGEKASLSREDWETPLGVVSIDLELVDELKDASPHLRVDELAHMYEHSIEVQLPFLQHRLKKFEFVPIAIMPDVNGLFYKEIANAIHRVIDERDVLVVASSDFTHFGEGYGFLPTNTNVLEWMKKTDGAAAEKIIEKDADAFLSVARETTICGKGAIAVLVNLMKRVEARGELLHYSTSYEVSRTKEMIVGYAAIAFRK